MNPRHNFFATAAVIPTFAGYTLPFTTTDTDGDPITIHCRLDDGTLLGINSCAFGPYPVMYNDRGRTPCGIYGLNPPKTPGRDDFDNAPHHVQSLINLTIRVGEKIEGIKALRGFFDLGLGDAKRLWEELERTR